MQEDKVISKTMNSYSGTDGKATTAELSLQLTNRVEFLLGESDKLIGSLNHLNDSAKTENQLFTSPEELTLIKQELHKVMFQLHYIINANRTFINSKGPVNTDTRNY